MPESWRVVPLAEVVDFSPGIDKSEFRDDDEVPFVPMPAVEAETGRIDTSARRPFGEVKSGFTAFASGDVLFAKITPCMENGKMAVAPALPRGAGFGTTEFHVLRPTQAVTADWIYYFVSSAALRHEAQHHMTGAVGQKRVPRRYLETKAFPLPPINEQRRIVEKIETLFARLDQGEAALRHTQTLLARYRQSVLKAAVTGALTADWRAANTHRLEHGRDLLARILQTRRETWQGRGKYQEPAAPDTSNLPELPEGWVWATVEQTARVIGGLTKNSKRLEMPLRKPMLRVANVYQNRLDLSEIHETGVSASECERVLLESLDLLVVEGNGSKDQIGRMAIWRNEIPGAVHQNHLIKIRMVEKGITEFAMRWFQSPSGRQKVEEVASSTSGLHTLSISKIEGLIVPIPSLGEIAEINERVDETFSKITHLENWCQTELTRSAALRQSILKDAFAGKLVPQDPSDEPAAELLARIRAGRITPSGRVGKAQRAHAEPTTDAR